VSSRTTGQNSELKNYFFGSTTLIKSTSFSMEIIRSFYRCWTAALSWHISRQN